MKKLVLLLCFLLLILAIMDVATTYIGVKTAAASEQNGTVKNIFDNYGFVGFAVIKIITVFVVVESSLYLYNNGLIKTIPLILVGLSGTGLLVIVNNLIVILGKREIYDYHSDFPIFVSLIFLTVMFLSVLADDVGIGKKLQKTH